MFSGSRLHPGRRASWWVGLPALVVLAACGQSEHVEDRSGMLDALQRWSARHYRQTDFVRSQSSCDLIAMPAPGQWEKAPCTLALRRRDSSAITKISVWAASSSAGYLLFHVDDPSFDPTSNQAWDQLAKSGTG